MSFFVSVDTNQAADIYFFKRENADDTTSPYSGVMRVQNTYVGIQSQLVVTHSTYEAYPEKTDMGFMAKASANADVSCEFELLLVQN